MKINTETFGQFDMYLVDDGTLDTVISVQPCNDFAIDKAGNQEIRFSQEYATNFRDSDGDISDEDFAGLAQEALDIYIEQYLID